MSIGIRPSANKFSSLLVQDSSGESGDGDNGDALPKAKPSQQPKSKTTSAGSDKKKQRRRKKKNSTSSGDPTAEQNGANTQKADWIARDENVVNNLFDEDLRMAIELSKVEYEKEERERSYFQSPSFDIPYVKPEAVPEQKAKASPTKKDKKRNKPHKTISLEEFHQHIENSLPLQPDETTQEHAEVVVTTAPPKQGGEIQTNFFDDVDKAVNSIKKSEEAKRRFEIEHSKQKTQNKNRKESKNIEEKDQTIEKLNNEIKEWEEKFKHVKKRNKQLLIMLQQGEMKDKSELLLEIERLSILREELTQEVTNLSESLEQERSRSRKYKEELLKVQERLHDDAVPK